MHDATKRTREKTLFYANIPWHTDSEVLIAGGPLHGRIRHSGRVLERPWSVVQELAGRLLRLFEHRVHEVDRMRDWAGSVMCIAYLC